MTEEHCGLTNCICTHNNGCVKGWLDGKKIMSYKHGSKGEVTTTEYDAVAFCPVCRPEQALIMRSANSRQEAIQKLQKRSKTQRLIQGEEESRSRTL